MFGRRIVAEAAGSGPLVKNGAGDAAVLEELLRRLFHLAGEEDEE